MYLELSYNNSEVTKYDGVITMKNGISLLAS